MFFTIDLIASCNKWPHPEVKNSKLDLQGRLFFGSIVGDALLLITTVIVGLGLLSTQGIPPAASYILLGVSGVIIITWLFLIIGSKGDVARFSKNLIKAAFSDNLPLRYMITSSGLSAKK